MPESGARGRPRLDSELGLGFALVTTVAPTPDERASIERRGAVVHVAAPGSELAQWLRRGRASAALVRPDRTVMQTGDQLAALCDALPTFVPSAKVSPGQ